MLLLGLGPLVRKGPVAWARLEESMAGPQGRLQGQLVRVALAGK